MLTEQKQDAEMKVCSLVRDIQHKLRLGNVLMTDIFLFRLHEIAN
jgi:hypothetical protein